MVKPLTIFIFHDRFFISVLYVTSIFIAYKTSKKLFILNLFVLIGIFVGCFYFISLRHPGNIIHYQMQGIIPILSVSFFNMYFFFYEKFNQIFKKERLSILVVFVSIIFLYNSFNYYKILENRTYKMNYDNITNEIINFNNDQISKENEAIIIGDEILLFIYFSIFKIIEYT